MQENHKGHIYFFIFVINTYAYLTALIDLSCFLPLISTNLIAIALRSKVRVTPYNVVDFLVFDLIFNEEFDKCQE